ncbi:hypothetical protein HHK36_018872 [Tetracentron sinense]|uniref:Pentatricopeptide repeat-containing protein n=1 Tax=Tetracentron sinense TaxID=13715 RepID=A0A835D921_TETSI|nr:hypothetical protein HHK36_018872 [Tetracentron sinense]
MKPNDVTMVSLLSACAKKLDLKFRRWVHSYIERNEIDMSLLLCNAMLNMYTKCASFEEAKDRLIRYRRRILSHGQLCLLGCEIGGKMMQLSVIFNKMPNQDIAAWNTLISAYEQNGQPK